MSQDSLKTDFLPEALRAALTPAFPRAPIHAAMASNASPREALSKSAEAVAAGEISPAVASVYGKLKAALSVST